MSMLACDECGDLIDTDIDPESHDQKTDKWICEGCRDEIALAAEMEEGEKTMKLKGEGEVKIIQRTRVRVECEFCGEDADNRHTYLLPNARSNPASSGYRGDDISRCSDHVVYSCASCREENKWHTAPPVEGYKWCSTAYNVELMPHLFLKWVEKEITETKAA